MATTISAQSLTECQRYLATISALEAQGDLARLEPAIKGAESKFAFHKGVVMKMGNFESEI